MDLMKKNKVGKPTVLFLLLLLFLIGCSGPSSFDRERFRPQVAKLSDGINYTIHYGDTPIVYCTAL